MQKYGFVYIWYDRKRKMFYVGCHWGTVDDGYICSSRRMRKAYRRRPNDFKRRIIKTNIERKYLLEEEHKWLLKIKKEELGKKYYNHNQHHFGHWSNNPENALSIKEKISIKTKEAMNRPDIREKMISIWESNKNRVQSEEEIQKRANSNRGQKRTEETKRKIREALTGEKNPLYGTHLTEEHKRKVSESLKGEKNPFFGKQHDPELKRQMSAKASATLKGRMPKNIPTGYWWNNGSINKRSHICPGKDWIREKLKRH